MYNFFPKIYDEFMEYADYNKWRELVLEVTEKYGVHKDSILDLGCGTGNLLIKLKDDFKNLSGMDISQNMIKIAVEKSRKEEANINFFVDDMVIFDIKNKVDVIVSFFDTLNHILSYDEMLMHFMSVKKALSEDGAYIFDYVDRDFMNQMFKNDLFVDERENFTCIWQLYQEEGIDFIESNYFVKNKNGTYDKVKEVYTKKIYEIEELEKIISKSGLYIVYKDKNSVIAGDRWIFILKNKK